MALILFPAVVATIVLAALGWSMATSRRYRDRVLAGWRARPGRAAFGAAGIAAGLGFLCAAGAAASGLGNPALRLGPAALSLWQALGLAALVWLAADRLWGP
jgi:hypothetical protein